MLGPQSWLPKLLPVEETEANNAGLQEQGPCVSGNRRKLLCGAGLGGKAKDLAESWEVGRAPESKVGSR